MTRMKLSGGLALACLTLSAGVASAQTTVRTTAAPAPAAGMAMRADTNGDGSLSRTEFVDARLAPLMAMDTDRNGTVTVAERAAARETRLATRATRRFERLDTDGNGSVSRAEFDAVARQARAGRTQSGTTPADAAMAGAGPRQGRGHEMRHQQGRGAGHGLGRAGARMGVGPGMAATPVVIAEVRTMAEAAFVRLDTDQNGALARTELPNARGAMRDRGQARRAGAMASGDAPVAADRAARREARREARRLRQEGRSPASPATPASE